MATSTFTKSGSKATTPAKLDKKVFGVEVTSHQLLKDAYVAYLANGRENYAVTKTRGLVSGGGKKPWKQKGTGRARFGSSRVPLWRGGGITFGPTGQENYTKKLTKNAKHTALKQALTLAEKSNKISIIESFVNKEGKTKETVRLLNKIKADRGTLLVVEDKTSEIDMVTRNVSQLKVVQAKYLNVFDVLNAHNIVITKKSLELITEWLSSSAKTSKNKGKGK